MVAFRFIGEYFVWHYTEALLDAVRIWGNLLRFLYQFFSISLLIHTLFSPWKRLGEERKGAFDFADIFSVIFINTIMRLIGASMRIVLITIGIIAIFFGVLVGIVALFAWIFAPVIIVTLTVIGVGIIFLEP